MNRLLKQIVVSHVIIKLNVLNVKSNYSFASAAIDNACFSAMFPELKIASNYQQIAAKVKYSDSKLHLEPIWKPDCWMT